MLFKRPINLVFILPFILFVFGYYFAHSFFHNRHIKTPNFIGKNVFKAIKKASKVGLNLRFLREKVDSELEAGLILEQSPKPHQKVKPNQHIFLTISRRPKGIETPKLLATNHKSIIDECRKLGIPVKLFWVKSNYPKNFCIAQYPNHGQKLSKKRLIAYISHGRNDLVVFPDLTNKRTKDVKEFLKKEGIELECIPKYDDNERTVVIDQKPVAGSIVDKSRKLYVQVQVARE